MHRYVRIVSLYTRNYIHAGYGAISNARGFLKGGSIMDITSTITLNNQVKIPQLGLGVYKSQEGEEAYNSVRWALEAGYRHIDTAKAYKNEASVGRAVHDSGIPREEIFITTKLWNGDMREDRQEAAFYESLEKLGVEYLDLYLIHWAVKDKYVASWKIMEKLYKAGLIRAIGVCNFHPHHLDTLMETAEIVPVLNQIELHPFLSQVPVCDFFREKGIAIEAWSPLARGRLLENPLITEMAANYDKTTAQIILRWHLQHGNIVIPKSAHKERIIGNADLYNFQLTDADMAGIDGLNQNLRFDFDPDTFTC